MIRLLAFLLLLPSIVFAQIEITWGIPQKEERKTKMTEMIGSDDSYLYSLRADNSLFGTSDPIVERYKIGDMSLDYTKRIVHKRFDGTTLIPAKQFFVDGHILAFATYYDRTRDVNLAFAEILDDRATVIQSWKEVARIPAEKRSNTGSFYFQLSQDSSNVLIICNPPYDQYADEKFTLQLLDGQLHLLWKNEINLPYKDKFFSLNNFIVNDSGNVYMLATISKDRAVMTRKERRTTPTYYHTVLMYNSANQELNEYEVKLDPKFISDIILAVTPQGDILCSGFYSNKSSNAITGTFYRKIDHITKKTVCEGTMDFPDEFLTQFMSSKRAAKNPELYDYNLRYLVQREDGGAILVAEQYYEYVVCSSDPRTGAQTCTYYYYYNDIIVVNVSPQGKIDWANKIPKLQVSRNDGGYFLSFAFAVSGNSLYFMFNDNPKNLSTTEGKAYKYMSNIKRSVAALVTMDMKGNQVRQLMFRNQDLKTYLRPKLFLQVNEQRMFLYGQRRSTFKLAQVKFE